MAKAGGGGGRGGGGGGGGSGPLSVRDARTFRKSMSAAFGADDPRDAIDGYMRKNRVSPRSAAARRLNAARDAVNEWMHDKTDRSKADAAQRAMDIVKKGGVGRLGASFNG